MRRGCTSPLKETRQTTNVKGGSVAQAIRQVFGHLLDHIQDLKHRSIEGFSDWLERYGKYVFDHPWRFVVIPTIVCIIFSSGFLFRTPELDMELLYGLPNTRSTLAKSELNRVFPLERITYLFAVSESGDGLLSKSQFEELYLVWNNITRIHVPRKLAEQSAVPGSTLVTKWMLEDGSYQLPLESATATREFRPSSLINSKSDDFIYLEDVCIRDAYDHCRSLTPFDLYTSARLWGTPIRMSDYPNFVNLRTGLGGRADALLGNITLETQGIATVVYNATSLTFRLDLQGGPNVAAESAAWEQALLLMVHKIQVKGIRFMAKTERSVNDELSVSSRLQGSDLIRLLCASLFVSSFSVFMNSSLDRYRSKWLPSAVGVGTTVLAYGGGVGLCHLIGIKHVPPAEATPFMILGICVDDIFVIINAYSFSYLHSDDARTRIGLSVRDAGVSVTITTLTNITAFAVGASSMYYSIRIFCILTVVGLFAGYLLCLTIFVGALSIDAYREQKYRGVPLFKPTPLAGFDTVVPLTLPSSNCNATLSASPRHARGEKGLPRVPFPASPQVPGETTSESSSSSEPSCERLKSTTPAYPATKEDRIPPTTCTGNSSVTDSSDTGDHPDWDSELQPRVESQEMKAVDQVSSNHRSSVRAGGSQISTTPLRNSPDEDNGPVDELLEHYRRCSLSHDLPDGFYSVENLDNHLVVAERVAEALATSTIRFPAPWFSQRKRLGRSKSDAGSQNGVVELTRSKISNSRQNATHRSNSNSHEGFSSEFDRPDITPQSGNIESDLNADLRYVDKRVTSTPNTPVSLEADSDLPPTFTSSPEELSGKGNSPLNVETPTPGSAMKSSQSESKPPISLIGSGNLVRLVKVKQSLIPLNEIDFAEPPGTVGKSARKFFIQVYGPNLMHPFWKIVVLLSFLACFIFALVKCFSVKAGLSLREVAPMDSYLVDFYDVRERDFATYGDECVVFFPKGAEWWHPAVIDDLQRVNHEIISSGSAVFVMNGMSEFLKYLNGTSREDISTGLIDNKQRFNWLFDQWLKSPRGMNFATHFKMEDGVLGAWKFYYWMPFIDNTSVAIAGIQDVRNILESAGSFTAHVFTPLAVLWETDPIIFRSTWTNMLIALITTGLVGMILIPDFRSGIMVLIMIVIIDVNVFGFMPLWHLNLNMLTMVNLILSIGFAVDYTTHITHCFSHARGTTRNRRSIETLVLMGLPISNGMLSTYAAVAALATAKKYVLIVTFQMVTTVLTFAFVHGVILMPVVLSLIGPFKTHEVDVICIKNGLIVSSHSMDTSSGMLVESRKSGKLFQPAMKGNGNFHGSHPANFSAASHFQSSGIRRRQLV